MVGDKDITEGGYLNANIFVSALKNDFSLKKAWDKLMSDVKNLSGLSKKDAKYRNALSSVRNFLIAHGFDCEPEEILKAMKSKLFAEHQKKKSPNDESDRFVKTVLGDSKLYREWAKAVKDAANGNNYLNKFLSDHKYQCTELQVVSSFHKMRHQSLTAWEGIYNAISVPLLDNGEIDNRKQQTNLTITILREKVYFDKKVLDKRLNNVKYKNGVLSWRAHKVGGVDFSGQIEFSGVMVKPDSGYTGNELIGTIEGPGERKPGFMSHEAPVEKRAIKARLNHDFNTRDDFLRTLPAAVDPAKVSKTVKYLGYFMVGMWVIDILNSLKNQAVTTLTELSEKGLPFTISAFEAELSVDIEKITIPYQTVVMSDTINGLIGKHDVGNAIIEETEDETAFFEETTAKAMGEGWLESLVKIVT